MGWSGGDCGGSRATSSLEAQGMRWPESPLSINRITPYPLASLGLWPDYPRGMEKAREHVFTSIPAHAISLERDVI